MHWILPFRVEDDKKMKEAGVYPGSNLSFDIEYTWEFGSGYDYCHKKVVYNAIECSLV
jgi:hypothetical protein